MSTRKHTPGPWTIEKAHSGGAGYRVVSDAAGYPNDGWNVAAEIIGPDRDANARLIAAAPDYARAAGLAITALSFALERAQREGDELAFAQISEAKQALIEADDKRTGRGQRQMIDVTPRRAAVAKVEGR